MDHARRFQKAILALAVLAILAAITLRGRLRAAVLFLLLALAVKTWIAKRKHAQDEAEARARTLPARNPHLGE